MTTLTRATPVTSRTGERALAPDLARGAMLLAIAFAHAPLFVTAVDRGPAVLNTITEFFHLVFVNNHARPMFAFLFGYALVQLLNREIDRGSDWVSARKLLRRRGWWLVVLGFAHTVVFAPIDILSVYGLTALVLVGLLRRRDAALLWTTGISLVPATAAVAFGMWYPLSEGTSTFAAGSMAAGDRGFGALLVDRVTAWPIGTLLFAIIVLPAVALGMWAARRGFLEEPVRHRRFLVRAAVITTVLSVAGAVPAGLVQAGVWHDPSPEALWAVATAQPLTGYAGGIGLAGIVALVAIRAARRRGRLTTMVEALGQRSLTLYLFQSLAFVVLFYPYGLGLQDDLGLAGATAVAAGTWVVSLFLADAMRRVGYRGPAEILLRRLVHRRRSGQDASGPR
ncbi:DUF418 domain-containing protein [Nonomuraea antimicrobica]